MSLLSGIGAGLGEYAGNKAKSMLDAQLSRYKGLSRVYETIASDPDIIDQNIKHEALRRVGVLNSVDPYNRATVKAAKGLENTQDIWDAHQNSKTGGQFMGLGKPSLAFSGTKDAMPASPMPMASQGVQQAVSGPPQAGGPVQQAVQPQQPQGPPQQTAQGAAPAAVSGPPSGNSQITASSSPETFQQRVEAAPPELRKSAAERSIEAMGSMGELVSDVVNHRIQYMTPAHKEAMQIFGRVFEKQMDEDLLRSKLQMFGDDGDSYGAQPGTPLAQKAKAFNMKMLALGKPIVRAQQVQLNGHPGSYWPVDGSYYIGADEVDAGTVVRDAGSVSYTTINRDTFGNVIGTSTKWVPLNQTMGMAGTPPPVANTPAPPSQMTPGGPQPGMDKPAGPYDALSEPEVDDWAAKAVPTPGPIGSIARRYISGSEDARKEVNGNKYVRQQVSPLLEKAQVWVPSDKTMESIKALEQSRYPVQLIGSLMDKVFKDGDVASAIELNRQIMSLGSIFAKTNYQQTGQLSNQEQIWARKGFMGAVEAFIAGRLDAAGFKSYEAAGRASLSDVMWLTDAFKRSLIKGKNARYIAGYGPVEDFLAQHDPTQKEEFTYPGGAGAPKMTPEQQNYLSKFIVQTPTGPVQ